MRDGWTPTTIGQIANVFSGYAFNSDLFHDSEGIPLIRIRDLPKRNETESFYLGEYQERFLVRNGDFLIGMDGEFRCYEWTGPEALLNQRVCRIQDFNLEAVVPRYVYFSVNQYLEKIEQNTGYTTVKHISAKQVLDIEIPLPPLSEQKRIVDLISSMDEYSQKLEFSLRTAKTLRSGLLANLLSGDHVIPSSYDRVIGEE
jgi:type I restriction enzyme S subunit